ncbi:MAG: hypothetical protein EOM22_06885 [Gammaproteobacteria bacterium]|nr:hypothetical protein [Gammaproteobacteria bacterium]
MFAPFNLFEPFRIGASTGETKPPAGFERLFVRKADLSGFEVFQVRKADLTGYEDFQVRTSNG